jgi:hypothetical protein
MKISAEISQLQSGSFRPTLFAYQDNGNYDESIKSTLLDLITSIPIDNVEFDELISLVESGQYRPNDPAYADWHENVIFVWFRAPYASDGEMAIFNEYVDEYSMDFGKPKIFKIDAYRAVRKFWVEFVGKFKNLGPGALIGGKNDIEVDA